MALLVQVQPVQLLVFVEARLELPLPPRSAINCMLFEAGTDFMRLDVRHHPQDGKEVADAVFVRYPIRSG
jgi:hypothetical protein